MKQSEDAPKTVKVIGEGNQQYALEGVAAQLVWFATRHSDFLNSPMVKGAVTLNFSGRDNSLSVVANLTN